MTNVSWDDAEQFAVWLSKTTGKTYRLLTEAEWEYAARGGSTTPYWWGKDVGTGHADCGGSQSDGTAPVGSFLPNAFGLYDTAGNAAEWVQDCWNPTYRGAPNDGSAWTSGDCSLRVLRGGSFADKAIALRSSARFRYDEDVRYLCKRVSGGARPALTRGAPAWKYRFFLALGRSGRARDRMSTLLKYAIFLGLAVAIGFYILYGPERPEDIAPIPIKRGAPVAHVEPAPSASIDEELDYLVAKRLGSLEGWRAFLAAHGSGAYAQSAKAEVERRLGAEKVPAEAAVAPVAPLASASIDEERDYGVAQRLGSLEGWRAFLAAHGSSVYAQSARAEVEQMLLAEKAPAPAATEVSNGASTDATAASEAMGPVPPPTGTEVSSGYANPAPAAAEVSNDASRDAKAVNEAAHPTPPLAGTDALAGTEVAALTPDEVCKRDGDRLARLRSSPSSDEAARFANELGCESLRPQVLALMESSGYAVPAPAAADVSNGASPD